MESKKEREDEKDGVLSVWQGYFSTVELVSFPLFNEKKIKKVAMGEDHSIFLTGEKEVYTCGKNEYGQLGVGELEPQYAFDPVRVTWLDGKSVSEVSCGSHHCAVVAGEKGQVYCWGDSKEGQCGVVKDRVLSPELVIIQDLSLQVCQHGIPATTREIQTYQVDCGKLHTMALSTGGELWAWGSGPALGISTTGTVTPTCVEALHGKKVLSVSCGDFHSFVLVEKQRSHERDKPKMSPAVETKTNKFYPSTCTKCNNEIYSYMDSGDTCIINKEHRCDTDEQPLTSNSDQVNMHSQSEESIHSIGIDETTDISLLGTSKNDVSNVSDNQASGKDNNSQHDSDITELDKALNPEQTGCEDSKVTLGDISSPNDNVGSQENRDEFSTSDMSFGKEKCEAPHHHQQPTETVQNKDGSEDNVSSKPSKKKDVGERNDFVENNENRLVSGRKDTCNNEAIPEADSSSLIETSLTSSVSKSHSFIDETEARQFLAKQYEDKQIPEPGESPTRFGTFWSALPKGPTDVLMQMSVVQQHVTSMTTKAFSTVVERMPSFATGLTVQDDVSKDLGDAESDKPANSSAANSSFQNVSGVEDNESDKSLSPPPGGQTSQPKDCAVEESSFIESINENTPFVDSSTEDLRDGEGTRMSLKTIWAKQEQLEKRMSLSSQKSESIPEQLFPPVHVTIDTEVFSWGKNNKGQLGVGDMIDRDKPCLVKALSGKHIVKVATGSNHSLMLTADSQVYSCGLNTSGQLGHSEEPSRLSRIKLMAGCYIWDIAAGECYSIFLMDRSGFQPEVHYVGKHPCKDVYVPIVKTNRLTALNFLKQAGWIRSIFAGGDNCACLSCWSFSGHTGTVYELSSLERRFYHYINRIDRHIIMGLQKTSFYTSLDVYPFKSTLQNLLSQFQKITALMGKSYLEIIQIIREGEHILRASLFSNYQRYLDEFRRYIIAFGDMLAINGFEYCAKTGSAAFNDLSKYYHLLFDEKKIDRKRHGNMFQKMMSAPLNHMKEYSRMSDKLLGNYPKDSEEWNVLSQVSLKWNSLLHLSGKEQATAELTGAFWDLSVIKHLVDALRVPSMRLIRESKTHTLTLQGGGRFTSHLFILFNDIFVHSQHSVYQVYQLDTLWVEAPSSDNSKQQQVLVITAPEDKLTIVAASTQAKTEWLLALNSAIARKLSNQKCVTIERSSMERLTPPSVRHARHTFTKHSLYRDAEYLGYWMNGLVHGYGEMKWNDGRKYTGHFKQGIQHGRGRLVIPKDDGTERIMEGYWRNGLLHGLGKVKYATGDVYEGYFRDGQRHGHGMYKHGSHTSSSASCYIGEWSYDKKQGYGVMDDVLKGEKYMGMWSDDLRHGNGIIVTLDGMYFEGNFSYDKMTGFGLMLTDDNSCYEGEFSGITQLQGKGILTMPTGDKIEGTFNGSWNEGLKITGTFHKIATYGDWRSSHSTDLSSSYYGKLCVPADKRWCDLFHHCSTILGVRGQSNTNTKTAWEAVAVMISRGRETLREAQKGSTKRMSKFGCLDGLDKIPPHNTGHLSIGGYIQIQDYLQKAFDTPFHPLGKLMEGLVDVFRAAYIGVGAHPRLLSHAVQEVTSYVKKLYKTVRILFPDLPANGGAMMIYPDTGRGGNSVELDRQSLTEDIDGTLVVSDGSLLHPILLPKIYPPLFDLYALYNDKEDEKYWERVQKLNKQGDMALMAYLGIDQKFWLIEESLFRDCRTKLSSLRDHCYLSSVHTLQQISTAFSPKEKLEVIQQTFLEITKTVQTALNEDHMWCMDELFPVFQYVVVRSKIRHLGAEVRLIEDLMEPHLENGELGIMFTTLHACYYQIQNEKIPSH